MKERIVHFGEGQALVGVLTTVQSALRPELPGLLLLNAGIIHHIGANRLNVKIARDFARNGYPVLRFDMSGLGDSRPARSSEGWEAQNVRDIRAAIDCLAREAGCSHAIAIGVCSGADNIYATAIVDDRLRGLGLLDPFAYPSSVAHARYLLRRAAEPARWFNFARRKTLALLGALGLRKTEAANGRRLPVNDYVRTHPPLEEYAANLARLAGIGVQILMIYTASCSRWLNAPGQVFATFRPYGLDRGLSVRVMGHADHVFTEIATQRELIAGLLTWAARVTPAGAAAADP
ncbi:MAG TPA: alpha/beta fold hydrolase [Rhodanobacteraceae bacterium]|nr:alpha/beta fold hydrolase [Rhodanobacteraceae bacterium]